jgi:hypothetical protein
MRESIRGQQAMSVTQSVNQKVNRHHRAPPANDFAAEKNFPRRKLSQSPAQQSPADRPVRYGCSQSARTPFNPLIKNWTATAASSKPMMRVSTLVAMELNHRAPRAETWKMR